MKRLGLVFISLLSFSAFALCPDVASQLPARYSYQLVQNVSYCEGLSNQKADIAIPKAPAKFPAIVFIHGGAWSGGDRTDFETEIEKDEKYNLLKSSAKRGFVAVTIDYRLSSDPSIKFPTHLTDVKCAIRWLKANASKYHVNPNRIGLAGASAGGHLALMAGLTPDELFKGINPYFGEQTGRVGAIVNWWGPSDIVRLYDNAPLRPLLKNVFGGELPKSEVTWREASPSTYLRSDNVPIQTVQGTEDRTIPLSQALEFDQKAKTIEANHELIICDGLGHGFEDPTGAVLKNDSELTAFEHMLNFFNANL